MKTRRENPRLPIMESPRWDEKQCRQADKKHHDATQCSDTQNLHHSQQRELLWPQINPQNA
jgi:hypothetical protein